MFTALIGALVLLFAAAFHFYWAMGGTIGISVAIPQHPSGARVFQPHPVLTHLVAFALLVAALLVLAAGCLLTLPFPYHLYYYTTCFLAVVFWVRAFGWFNYAGLFKRVRNTTFAKYDTYFYSPLCFVLAASLTHVAFTANP